MIDIHKILKKQINHTERAQKSHPVSRALERGWTLVELAVVLVIVGLLIGGMLRGEELYNQVKARRLFMDMNSVMAAIKGFQDRYSSVPGDFPLATQRIPGCTSATIAPFCRNGNGDTRVGRAGGWGSGWDKDQTGAFGMGTASIVLTPFYEETTQFWKHLALAGFIKNVNPQADPARPQWYQTHPGAVIGGGYQIFTDTITAGSSVTIRFQREVKYYPGTTNTNPAGTDAIDPDGERPFTLLQAKFLDEKYDDGKPAAGYVWGIPYSGAPGVNQPCRIGGGAADYNLPLGHQRVCQQHFVLH